jgi:hypothetical protein
VTDARNRRHATACAAPTACLALFLGSALFPREAMAQIVNVQPLVAAEDREGPSGALEGSLDWRSGNTELALGTASLVARYRAGRHLAFVLGRVEYGENANDVFLDKDLEHLRYRVVVAGPLEGEVFGQHDRDEFRRLSLRMVTGAGPRLHFLRWEPLDAAVGVAYMLEHEVLGDASTTDSGEATTVHRLSTYATLALDLADRVALSHTFYVQPRFDAWSDVRVLSETELLLGVVKHVSVKVSLSMAIDAQPPQRVEEVDAVRKVSLQLSY